MTPEGLLLNDEAQAVLPEAIAARWFAPGVAGTVVLQLFTAKLGVGSPTAGGYDDLWCYDNPARAILALVAWDGTGEPDGWSRHPRTGRRRPGGDPRREYVAP